MSLHDPQCLCCIIQSLLIDDHSLVSFLEEWVESVKNGGVANVGILEDCPLTISDGFDKYGVDPLKSGDASLANPHKRLELIKDGSMSFQEGFHVFDLFGEVKRMEGMPPDCVEKRRLAADSADAAVQAE